MWPGTVKQQIYGETARTLENSKDRKGKKRLPWETIKTRGKKWLFSETVRTGIVMK